MNRRVLIIILTLIIIAIAVLAVVVGTSMPTKSPSEIIITEGGKQSRTDLEKLELTDVKGTITMASGKTKTIDAKGIELGKLLEGKSYEYILVSAEDNYSAKLSREEAEQPGNAYIILDKEKKPRLVVLSDTNAKRDVKNVLSIELK